MEARGSSGAVHPAVVSGARLEAVRASGLLDTAAEEPFDRLTRLAATILDAPLAFVTVVDERRSFWKSCFGVDATDPADRQNPVEESFCQYVVGSDAELIVGDAASDPRTRANPSIEKMGVAAWAGFPLRAPDGQVLGSFCVVDTVTRQWTDRDVAVLRDLAAAAAGEVALRAVAQRSAELAQTLQATLLPPVLPTIPHVDLAARYLPAGEGTQVVGDFYDVFQSADDRWIVVIGDVCGKGVEAAKVTALAHYALRSAAMRTDSPSVMLTELNAAMRLQYPGGQTYLTALAASLVVAPRQTTMMLCTAGHPPALLRRASGEITALDGDAGSLIGCFDVVRLTDRPLVLQAGDTLVLYTDGVTDARHGSGEARVFFGDKRLRELIAASTAATADALAAEIARAAKDFTDGPLYDDTACLVLRAGADSRAR